PPGSLPPTAATPAAFLLLVRTRDHDRARAGRGGRRRWVARRPGPAGRDAAGPPARPGGPDRAPGRGGRGRDERAGPAATGRRAPGHRVRPRRVGHPGGPAGPPRPAVG